METTMALLACTALALALCLMDALSRLHQLGKLHGATQVVVREQSLLIVAQREAIDRGRALEEFDGRKTIEDPLEDRTAPDGRAVYAFSDLVGGPPRGQQP